MATPTTADFQDAYNRFASVYQLHPTGTMTEGGVLNSVMLAGDVLHKGEFAWSSSRQYMLVMQLDGNLVWYAGIPQCDPATGKLSGTFTGAVAWAAGSGNGDHATIQHDGNFVVYDTNEKPTWAASWKKNDMLGGFGQALALQDDGNLVVYQTGGNATWSCCFGTGPSSGGFWSSIGNFFTSPMGIATVLSVGVLSPTVVGVGVVGSAAAVASAAAIPVAATATAIANPKVVPDILSGNIVAAVLDATKGIVNVGQATGVIPTSPTVPVVTPVVPPGVNLTPGGASSLNPVDQGSSPLVWGLLALLAYVALSD